MSHLLVTNDFPPKLGGIQSYLWELWRRLDPGTFTVLTTPYQGAETWDAEQRFRVVRTPQKVLLPTPSLARRIEALAVDQLHLVSPSREEAIVLQRVLPAEPPAKSIVARR